jgi:putative membrane protein
MNWMAVLASLIFGLIGIALTIIGYKMFDVCATTIDVPKELTEKQNVAVAIVVAAVTIGVAMVVSSAITG